MTKETYLSAMESLRDRINALHNEKRVLTNKYIDANKKFPVGARIKTINGEGIVKGFEVDYNDEVRPIANVIKKDGTEGVRKLWIGYNAKIDVLELPNNELQNH